MLQIWTELYHNGDAYNEIKPTFYGFNNVISLTYVFYLILHLVYKLLYLYHILS